MGSKSATLRVLVAEDSVEMRHRIVAQLHEVPGIEVVGPAGSGTEALALFESESIDCALLDFAMPGLTGLQVLTRIRAAGSTVPVIILTAHAEPAVEAAVLAAGADHYFTKQGDFDDILSLLKRQQADRGA